MISLVSDNGDVPVERIDYKRVAQTPSETDSILATYPDDVIVPVTDKYQAYVHHSEVLDAELRPVLKKYTPGPFAMAIQNHGDRPEKIMIVFELCTLCEEKPVSGPVIHPKPEDWLSRAIAVLPFIDIFHAEIMKEANQAERLLKSAKVQSLQNARDDRDQKIVTTMTKNFLDAISPSTPTREPAEAKSLGKECIADTLAVSLNATNAFYLTLWAQMANFYAPLYRHLGEQYALGNVSLDRNAGFKV